MFSTILLNLIVFFLPTQLGHHFWPDFSRAAGIKIDYLSPTLYFVDILIILYIASATKKIFTWLMKHHRGINIFLLFILVNVWFGLSPLNSLFWWLRQIVYILFFITLRVNKITWSNIKTPLLYSLLTIIFLETCQLLLQHSVGGLFYWLGERFYNSSTPGLAKINFLGTDFIRSPSTFSHPNSLAGFLLIAYYLLHHYKSPLWQRLIVFCGLVLTLSKAALLAFVLVMSFHLNAIFLINAFLIFSLLQIFIPYLPRAFQFISDRQFLVLPVRGFIKQSPLAGIGLGNFVPALANYLPGSFLVTGKLQPLHNTTLLYTVEMGTLGVILLLIFIKNNLKKISKPAILSLIALVIVSGAFDHYWITLPQNKLILILAAAIML